MLFEWDPEKNKVNIQNHGIDFQDAGIIFDGPQIVFEDERKEYGEKRWILFGLLSDVVVSVVYTIRSNKVRIISMRRVNKRERREYEQKIKSAQESQENE